MGGLSSFLFIYFFKSLIWGFLIIFIFKQNF